MLLYENFMILCNLNLGQIPFSLCRKFAKNGESIAKLRNQLWFLSVCIRKNVFPKTVLNMRIPGIHNQYHLHQIRTHTLKLLKSEVRRKLHQELRDFDRFSNLLSIYDQFDELLEGRNRIYSQTYLMWSRKVQVKVHSLMNEQTSNVVPTTDSLPLNTRSYVITDKTNSLTMSEAKLLDKGPNFAVANAVNNDTRHQLEVGFLRFAYQYRWSKYLENASNDQNIVQTHPVSKSCKVPPEDTETSNVLQLLYASFKQIIDHIPNKPKWVNLTNEEKRAVRSLKNKNICILPSDKGREFCVISNTTYTQLANEHLSDRNVYIEVRQIKAPTIEKRINKIWKRVCINNRFPKYICRSYSSNNSILPSFYHLIKTHKEGINLKIRPIVTSIDGPAWRICYFINVILKPYLQRVPAHLENSQILLTAINNLDTATKSTYNYPFSLDVCSLYTSIPISDALTAIKSFLENINANLPISITDILSLIKVVLENSYFVFQSKLFYQHNGLPMGCNISPVIAIIFMHRIETRALNIFSRVGLFKRYIDDIFILVEDECQANTLFNVINNLHPTINFEIEHPKITANKKTLSLLDFTINVHTHGTTDHDFYQKKAKRDLFIHSKSHLPSHVKENVIRNEINRRASKCSTITKKNIALNKFREHLISRGYTHNFLNAVENKPQRRARNNNNTFYLNLPFISDTIDRKIKNLFRRKNINVRITRSSNKLFNVFKPKRESLLSCNSSSCPTFNTALCHKKNVVYGLKCSGCEREYIGQTQRFLHTRVNEHQIGRNSKPHTHFNTCSSGNFTVKILSQQKDPVNTMLSESIYIKNMNPQLNNRDEILNLF